MSITIRALKRVSISCTLALLPAVSFGGFFISNGQLVDNNGTPFVMRGINYPPPAPTPCARCCPPAASGRA